MRADTASPPMIVAAWCFACAPRLCGLAQRKTEFEPDAAGGM
jgi:hypothetical protein